MKPLLLTLLLAGCTDPLEYLCERDAQCVLPGQVSGVCAMGACAFSDTTCTSGYRYHVTASGGRGNKCVGVPVDDLSASDSDAMPDLPPPDLGPPDLVPPPPDMHVPSFHIESVPSTCPACSLNHVWQASTGEAYAVGFNGAILYTAGLGAMWKQEASNTSQVLRDVWGVATGEVYVVGEAGVAIRSKVGTGSWSPPLATGLTTDLFGVWASSNADIYAVGAGGKIIRSTNNGTDWSAPLASNTGYDLYAIWGSGPADIWVVGTNGTALRSTNSGVTWTPITVTGEGGSMAAVGGSGPGDVYVCGTNLNRTTNSGGFWSPVAMPQVGLGAFTSVWAASNFDVWALATDSKVHHLVGTWQFMNPPTGTPGALRKARGRSSVDFFMVGSQGSIVHYY